MSEPLSGKRRDRRYVVDVDATIHLPEGGQLKARTRDVSRNGICLVAAQALPVGVVARLELVLSFGDNSFSEPLNLSGRLVWCTNLAGSYQVGAMFEDVTDQQDQFLEMFLQYLDGTLSPRGDDDEEPTA